jgi:hypothetical protein
MGLREMRNVNHLTINDYVLAFLLPTTLGKEMQRMINSFGWGTNRQQGRGINWLSWDKLTMRKEFGGMGFRHLYGFNLAMLGKQG